jgi:CRISPR-associated endonuclease/helicase Cas3
MADYLAHVRRNEDGSFAIHRLEDHLRAVGDRSSEFASAFGATDWGRLAGLWHNLETIAFPCAALLFIE